MLIMPSLCHTAMGMVVPYVPYLLLVILSLCTCTLCEDSPTCYNMTIKTSEEYSDVTVFQGAPTVSCEDGFGCTKTLIYKGTSIVAVNRGCGIFGCLGRACFQLHGRRLCMYCCRTSNCNGSSAMTFSVPVTLASLVASWLISKQY